MEDYQKGIEKIKDLAKFFLEDLGEFAPFGMILKNDEWIDLGSYDEDLDSLKMRALLMNSIKKDFESPGLTFGGVCVNAIQNEEDIIIIYNTSDGVEWYELIYRITKVDDVISFYEI